MPYRSPHPLRIIRLQASFKILRHLAIGMLQSFIKYYDALLQLRQNIVNDFFFHLIFNSVSV